MLFFLPQRFIMLLTEHLVRCETGSVDISTPWYKNCIERLQQIFLMVKHSHTHTLQFDVCLLSMTPCLSSSRSTMWPSSSTWEPWRTCCSRQSSTITSWPCTSSSAPCSSETRTHTHWRHAELDGSEMCACVHTVPVLNLHTRNYQLLHQESPH